MVFGLFIFGFNNDHPSVFEETVKFNIGADFDMCAYSVLTPYPGTLLWYQMKPDVVSFDWDLYDQGHIVYKPRGLTPNQLREGHMHAYSRFYALPSIAKRFPLTGSRSRTQWGIYNTFFRKGEVTGRNLEQAVASATAEPEFTPRPPIMPLKKEWRDVVEEGIELSEAARARRRETRAVWF